MHSRALRCFATIMIDIRRSPIVQAHWLSCAHYIICLASLSRYLSDIIFNVRMSINMLGAIFIIPIAFGTKSKGLIRIRFLGTSADRTFVPCDALWSNCLFVEFSLSLHLCRCPEAFSCNNKEHKNIEQREQNNGSFDNSVKYVG